MARCEDCLHYEICEIMNEQYGISKVYPSQCGFYTNTADVVPKSEVEGLQVQIEHLTAEKERLNNLIQDLMKG